MSKCVMFAETYRLSLKNYFQRHSLKLTNSANLGHKPSCKFVEAASPEMNKETAECQSPPERHWASIGESTVTEATFSAHPHLLTREFLGGSGLPQALPRLQAGWAGPRSPASGLSSWPARWKLEPNSPGAGGSGDYP